MITPALIVGGTLELPVEMTAYLVSIAMITSGVGTYLQVNRFGPVGSGMLSIQSVNFSFVTITIALPSGSNPIDFNLLNIELNAGDFVNSSRIK